MELPRDDSPPEALLSHSAYTLAAVAADPKVAGLEAGLKTGHATLKQCVRDTEDKTEAVHAAEALFETADRTCDNEVRSFNLMLFGVVEKKRENPLYQRYFKDGIRAVTEAEPRSTEPDLVKDIITALDEDAANAIMKPVVTEFRPRLQTAVDAVVAKEAALSTVEGELRYLEDKTLPAARATWLSEYVKLHGKLKDALPDEPQRVERYFRRFRKAAKKPAASDPTADIPADGTSKSTTPATTTAATSTSTTASTVKTP